MSVKILFFAGSARKDSVNKKLARLAYEHAKDKDGVEASFIDLADYPMPIYDGDLEDESGLPEHAKRFKQLLIAQDGVFIAMPEYNSSLTPLLKNALDWASRQESKDEPPLKAYKNKVAALASASPSYRGGLRGLVPLRMMLGNIGVYVTPEQATISDAYNAFDDQGALKDERNEKSLHAVVDQLVEATKKLQG